jgi:glycerol-3-phosphate acyltransferase PlsY
MEQLGENIGRPSFVSFLAIFLGESPMASSLENFFQKDPRDYGSHNSGGTNVGRVFGKWIGILVIALDMIKCMLAFWSVWAIFAFGRASGSRRCLR